MTIEFDHAGVARHLTAERHIEVFRQLCTMSGDPPTVAEQPKVAEWLQVIADEREGGEMTVEIIREFFGPACHWARWGRRTVEKTRKPRGAVVKLRARQREFQRAVLQIERAAIAIADMAREWPKDESMPIEQEFTTAVRQLVTLVDSVSRATGCPS